MVCHQQRHLRSFGEILQTFSADSTAFDHTTRYYIAVQFCHNTRGKGNRNNFQRISHAIRAILKRITRSNNDTNSCGKKRVMCSSMDPLRKDNLAVIAFGRINCPMSTISTRNLMWMTGVGHDGTTCAARKVQKDGVITAGPGYSVGTRNPTADQNLLNVTRGSQRQELFGLPHLFLATSYGRMKPAACHRKWVNAT